MRVSRLLMFCLAIFLCAGSVHAAPVVTVTFDGQAVRCPSSKFTANDGGVEVAGWSWGAGNTTQPGSPIVGKPTFNPFLIMKGFDACTIQLLPSLFGGKVFRTITVREYKNSPQDGSPLLNMTVTLTNAYISNYDVGSTDDRGALEAWKFVSERICLKDAATSTEACWDLKLNRGN